MIILHEVMRTQLPQLKSVIWLYAFLFVVWGFYRALFKLPEEVEELVLKPILWLGPLVWLLRKEAVGLPTDRVLPRALAVAQALAKVGWTTKNLFKSIYLAIGLGVLFAAVGVLVNILKYGQATFSSLGFTGASLLVALGISLATAISEETVFRGFIFARILKVSKHELFANVVTSLGWGIIHIPVLVFAYKLGLSDVSLRFFLTTIFGLGSAFVFARTGNIVSSVLLHVLWSWPIILFR